MKGVPRVVLAGALAIGLAVFLVGSVLFPDAWRRAAAWRPGSIGDATDEAKPALPGAGEPVPLQALVFDLPAGWKEIPGKLSRTFRSSREGAGLFQISMHPPLKAPVDGRGVERELDSLLREMKSEMEFGPRMEIGHLPARAGALAFAKYQSPRDGMLGFWLLSGESAVFATYVDGGTTAAPADLREAQEALRTASFE